MLHIHLMNTITQLTWQIEEIKVSQLFSFSLGHWLTLSPHVDNLYQLVYLNTHIPLQFHSWQYSFWFLVSSHTQFPCSKMEMWFLHCKTQLYNHLFSSDVLKAALELQGFESKENGDHWREANKSSSRVTATVIPVRRLA